MPPAPATLNDWIATHALPFSPNSSASLNSALDSLLASLPPSLAILGLGEPLHGSDEILFLRNAIFQRLVEGHGFTAIALETSLPRARAVNAYIADPSAPASYDSIQESGFSHNFGRSPANRALVEWMRSYNADPARPAKLHFYGFDTPTEMTGNDSPRQLLNLALDFLAALDPASALPRRQRIEALLGPDAPWENPAAMFDPAQSIGRSPAAAALRLETEDLITELSIRRPELTARSSPAIFDDALRHAASAREFLTYHAGLATPSPNRTAQLLGLRDFSMAENLTHLAAQEQHRGKLFAFAHNSHLQRGQSHWQLGPDLLTWWPAGAHLAETLGQRYAVIGTAIGAAESLGIPAPEPLTLEARLTASPGPARFISTQPARHLTAEISALPTRTSSNPGYFPLTPQSLANLDVLLALNTPAAP